MQDERAQRMDSAARWTYSGAANLELGGSGALLYLHVLSILAEYSDGVRAVEVGQGRGSISYRRAVVRKSFTSVISLGYARNDERKEKT
eukprot:scaffold6531_cov169-Ochromonas_danica.AAC.13